jgi:hypothetical protein
MRRILSSACFLQKGFRIVKRLNFFVAMKKLLFAFLLLPVLVLQAQDIKLKKVKLNDALSVRLPEDFSPLTEQEMNERYASARQPIAFYASADRRADFSLNTSTSSWASSDLPLAKDFYKASLSALYTDIDWIREEIIEIDDRQFAVFEFIGTVADTDENQVVRSTQPISKYIQVAYALVNNKAVVVSFSAPAAQQTRWQPLAHEILDGLRIKKTL